MCDFFTLLNTALWDESSIVINDRKIVHAVYNNLKLLAEEQALLGLVVKCNPEAYLYVGLV